MWSSAQTSRVEAEQPERPHRPDRLHHGQSRRKRPGALRQVLAWRAARAWPAKPKTVKMPPKFFRGEDDGGEWPAEATLEMARPPGYDKLSDAQLAAVVKSSHRRSRGQVSASSATARERSSSGERRSSPSRATPRLRARPDKRFGISPKVACKDKWRRIERLRYNKRWSPAVRHRMGRMARRRPRRAVPLRHLQDARPPRSQLRRAARLNPQHSCSHLARHTPRGALLRRPSDSAAFSVTARTNNARKEPPRTLPRRDAHPRSEA